MYRIIILIRIIAEPQFAIRLAQYGGSKDLNTIRCNAVRFLDPTTSDADHGSYFVDVASDALEDEHAAGEGTRNSLLLDQEPWKQTKLLNGPDYGSVYAVGYAVLELAGTQD